MSDWQCGITQATEIQDLLLYLSQEEKTRMATPFRTRSSLKVLVIHPSIHLTNLLSIYFGEGNGTPLQYSCLENPIDRGAW